LIAGGWAVFLWATFPAMHSREMMDVARVTCPISLVGEHYHFGVWVGWVLVSNAAFMVWLGWLWSRFGSCGGARKQPSVFLIYGVYGGG